MRAWFGLALGLVGCAGGASGDWLAESVEAETGRSVASGHLWVDRDGEVELSLTLAGDGPEGVLEATGQADTDRERTRLSLVGTWSGGDAAAAVAVEGDCEARDRRLTCALQVDGEPWSAAFRREPALD